MLLGTTAPPMGALISLYCVYLVLFSRLFPVKTKKTLFFHAFVSKIGRPALSLKGLNNLSRQRVLKRSVTISALSQPPEVGRPPSVFHLLELLYRDKDIIRF